MDNQSRITADQVRALLEERMESSEPDAILEVLRKHAGKPLTVRILDKLPGGQERWRIRREFGMANLETRDYRQTHGRGGMSILLAHSDTNVLIDPAYIERHNTSYFEARVERNAKRLATKTDPAACERMAERLNRLLEARAALAQAEAALAELTGFDQPFSPDSTQWDRLSGEVSRA